MDAIRQYILSVLSAAIITSLLVRFANKQEAVGGIIKLIASVFLSIAVVAPIIKMQILDISEYVGDLEADGKNIISDAKVQVENETVSIILEKVQAYIEDKAATYGAEITATVGISEPDSLRPDTVEIEGKVSPYVKEILQDVIADDLGIQEDNQIWN